MSGLPTHTLQLPFPEILCQRCEESNLCKIQLNICDLGTVEWCRNQPQENRLSTPQKRPVFRHPKSKVCIANRAMKAPLSLGVLTAPPFPLGLCGPPGRRLGRPPPPRGGYRPISGRARPPAPPASTAPQPGPGIDSGALKPGKAGMLFKTPLLLGDPKRDPA